MNKNMNGEYIQNNLYRRVPEENIMYLDICSTIYLIFGFFLGPSNSMYIN